MIYPRGRGSGPARARRGPQAGPPSWVGKSSDFTNPFVCGPRRGESEKMSPSVTYVVSDTLFQLVSKSLLPSIHSCMHGSEKHHTPSMGSRSHAPPKSQLPPHPQFRPLPPHPHLRPLAASAPRPYSGACVELHRVI